MWEAIKQFFIDNSAAIIISLVIGALFFILGPLGLWFSGKKVKREKINKAKSELLDLVESMLVNDEKITVSKLITLFRAVERQNGNNLGLDSDLNNILEDLTLRFAKSKHLSSEQKDVYIDKIDKLIESVNRQEVIGSEVLIEKRELPKSFRTIIKDLKAESESETVDKKKLVEKIEQLEKRILGANDPFLRMARLIREKPQVMWTIMIIYLIIFIIVLFLTEKVNFG